MRGSYRRCSRFSARASHPNGTDPTSNVLFPLLAKDPLRSLHMTIFIIGGTGFIGRYVTQRLASRDHDIVVFHRGQTNADLPDEVVTIQGTRENVDALRSAVKKTSPDVVLDVIPYTEAHAEALITVCEGQIDRVVVISSGDVYRQYDGLRGESDDPPDPIPLDEDAPLRTSRYPYRGTDVDFAYADEYDKILVEQRLRSADLPVTILRLPKVYGPGDREHHVGNALERLQAASGTLVLSEAHARWRWSRGYVSNVAAAVADATTDPIAAGRTYNVGEPDALPEATWLRKLAEVAGISTEIRTVRDEELSNRPSFDWQYSMALDTRRIRTELKFAEQISHEQALVRSIISVQ